jgi:hypothetical protein
MNERDERPLSEIQFAIDVKDPEERAGHCTAVRGLLAGLGVHVAQDIVELGCTGVVYKLHEGDIGKALRAAQFIRQHMGGSLCGLPCYVPPNRFCLVHSTIGALQLKGNVDGPQASCYPEALPICSRELTAEERAAHGKVQAKIMADAATAALDLGAEIQPTDPLLDALPQPSTTSIGPQQLSQRGAGTTIGDASFKCPEHAEFEPKCRFCLAQAVAEGPLEPKLWVRAWPRVGDAPREVDPRELATLLSHNGDEGVELRVLAARWVRKLTRV